MAAKSNDNSKITLGKIIKHYRQKLGLTQAQLAKEIGVGLTAISNYESDYSTPKLSVLNKISALFKVKIDELLNADPDIELKMSQHGYTSNSIPFYAPNNIGGMRSKSVITANSFLELPSVNSYNTLGLICTQIKDNSMINSGIPSLSYIIVNPDRVPHTGDTVAVIDNQQNKLLVRIIAKDGPLIHLSSNGNGDIDSITTNESDDNYEILGTVVACISKLNFFDE